MKYNYITSIFLLILVVIISQVVYIHSEKKIVEGWKCLFKPSKCKKSKPAPAPVTASVANSMPISVNKKSFARYKFFNRRNLLQSIREAAERARRNFVAQFVNSRQTPYVNLLGTAYVNNQTSANLIAYNEAIQIDSLASQTKACNSDSDIGKIIILTSDFLNGNGQNSTKVYFLSEILKKSLGQFFIYNQKSNETQYNYLSQYYPNTFKDDDIVTNKYMKFCNLMALAEVAKTTTSTSLQPVGNYFMKISEPILYQSTKLINEFKKIKYDLTDKEKEEIQNRYKRVVK
jgi:hypothetical protein